MLIIVLMTGKQLRIRTIRLPRWYGDLNLEEPYIGVLRQLADHRPRAGYSIVAHGSVLWGDRTVLRSGLPVSDIDILVVGKGYNDLSVAAQQLQPLTQSLKKWGMPTFKIGAKFRTCDEIGSEQITANELGALTNGSVLSGGTLFEVADPQPMWYRSQAVLSLATRLFYTHIQSKDAARSQHRRALRTYFSSRLILEISTIALLIVGVLGRSYSSRVRLISAEYSDDIPTLDADIRGALGKALHAKRNPEAHSCYELEAANALLIRGAQQLGIEHTEERAPSEFWLCRRPLDVRDRKLWPVELQPSE